MFKAVKVENGMCEKLFEQFAAEGEKMYTGCRQKKEGAARAARQYMEEHSGEAVEVTEKPSMVLRIVRRNLGNRKYPDMREILEIVYVDKITERCITGRIGFMPNMPHCGSAARVSPEMLVAWEA